MLFRSLQRTDCDGALPWLVNAARAAASVIRDRFSPDAWRALTALAETIGKNLTREAVVVTNTGIRARYVVSGLLLTLFAFARLLATVLRRTVCAATPDPAMSKILNVDMTYCPVIAVMRPRICELMKLREAW